jgi:hypothetical protein
MINASYIHEKRWWLAGLAVAAWLALLAIPAMAQVDVFPQCGADGAANSDICKARGTDATQRGQGLFGADSVVGRITQAIIFAAGSIAVLMIVIGGLRYVLSNGDPQGTQRAKNTILYAVIGLVIALAAEAILRLVLRRL